MRIIKSFMVVMLALLTVVGLSGTSSAAVESTPLALYSAHVQSIGWMDEVQDGATAGTTGRALRLEALKLTHSGATGPFQWRGHVQSIGWQSWRDTPSTIGTTGLGKRLEAFQIKIADPDSEYSVEYRAHVQSIGWQGWKRDGALAGTTGLALRVEAVQIRVVPKDTSSVTLAFTADTGLESTGKAVLANIGSRNPEVTNILGDLAYEPNAVQTFCDQVNSRINGKVQIVAGNHEEMGSEDGYIDDYAACLPDESNSVAGQWSGAEGVFDSQFAHDYYYDLENVRVILISPDIEVPGTDARYTSGTPEREWLKQVVREAKSAGKWTIVGMHHPCFSIGLHGCSDTTSAVSDLTIGLGVDLTISGHDHNYSRTHQIRGTKASPVIIDKDNDYAAQTESTKGSVFAVVGNGGHNPRSISTPTSIYAAANGTNSTGGFTFGHSEVTVTTHTLSYNFVASGAGALVDSFTISR